MKHLLIAGGLFLMAGASHGQNNQIKLYVQQIAANKVYIEYLQKGYKIAKDGLHTIGNIKGGHFSLDKDFFSGLEQVNPTVSGYAKVAAIVTLNDRILKEYQQTAKQVREKAFFNAGEINYVEKVYAALIEECAGLTDQLTELVSSGKLKMTDDERIRRIELIYAAMQERYVFSNSFSASIHIMVLQRSKELTDTKTLRGIFDNKKPD